MLYILDAKGVIRYKFRGFERFGFDDEFENVAGALLKEMEQQRCSSASATKQAPKTASQ